MKSRYGSFQSDPAQPGQAIRAVAFSSTGQTKPRHVLAVSWVQLVFFSFLFPFRRCRLGTNLSCSFGCKPTHRRAEAVLARIKGW